MAGSCPSAKVTAASDRSANTSDRFLAGDDNALSSAQLEGAQTFMTLKIARML